jgi:hypothetical protein
MLVDRKWIQATAVAVLVLSSVQVYAADTEDTQDDTYLSKVKALSQDSAALTAPATSEEDSDVLAKQDIKNDKFKPDLSELKPKL